VFKLHSLWFKIGYIKILVHGFHLLHSRPAKHNAKQPKKLQAYLTLSVTKNKNPERYYIGLYLSP
jgi:hypothetical protein